jgi:outer membrane lipoprotein-sorting protein
MIDAQGGKKKLENVNDTFMTGNFELVSMGMKGAMTIYSKEPNKIRRDIEVMGQNITMAYDGETAWMINPQGSQEMPENQADEFKREALGRDAVLNPKKVGVSYNYKGKKKIKEIDCHMMEQTYSDGHKITLYIDTKTYLVYMTKGKGQDQAGNEVESETYLSEYKIVEGIQIPKKMVVFNDGQEFMVITIKEVKFNTGVKDDKFVME